MDTLLDQLLDLLEMNQLNVTRINELLNECIAGLQHSDKEQVKVFMAKRNIILNRVRMIDEALNRSQVALLGFERLRPAVEKYYQIIHE